MRLGGDVFGLSDAPGKGVFASADGGTSWEEVGRGLPASGASALALEPGGGRLYAATVGSVYALTAR